MKFKQSFSAAVLATIALAALAISSQFRTSPSREQSPQVSDVNRLKPAFVP